MNKKMITLVLAIAAMATALTTVAGPCGGGRGCRPCPPRHPHHGYDWNHGGRQDFWMSFAGAAAGALVGGIVNNANAQRETVVVQQPVQYTGTPIPQYVEQQQQQYAPAQPITCVQPQVVTQPVATSTATTQVGGQVAYQQRTTRVWVPGHYEISQTGGYQTWIGGHYETVVVQ